MAFARIDCYHGKIQVPYGASEKLAFLLDPATSSIHFDLNGKDLLDGESSSHKQMICLNALTEQSDCCSK